MASLERHKLEMSASTVILSQLISIPFIVSNGYIVVKEMKKRRNGSAEFESNSMKWISLFALMGGLIVAFASLLSHFNGLCHFMEAVSDIAAYSETLFVGLYQLLRLYHMFAHTRVYSGYHISTFILMASAGIAVMVCVVIVLFRTLGIVRTHCGLDSHYRFYAHTLYFDIEWNAYILFEVISATHFVWELTTLLLFVYRMRALIAQQNEFILSTTSSDMEFQSTVSGMKLSVPFARHMR